MEVRHGRLTASATRGTTQQSGGARSHEEPAIEHKRNVHTACGSSLAPGRCLCGAARWASVRECHPEWTLQMGQNLNMSRRTGTLIAIGVFVAIVIVLIVLSAY